MKFDVNNLTLIDLISEKHAHLRKTVERRWEEQSDIKFSHVEWYLLSKIEQENLTISKAASIVGISRQAMQKTVKRLEHQGYIISCFREGNKRDKFLFLTEIGKKCCFRNNQLKIKLEHELEELLGKDEVKSLKALFRKNWIIN